MSRRSVFEYLDCKKIIVTGKMPSPLYEENEVVLVQDRGKLYEAKILKTKQCNESWKYFVHFQGWNRKFDCWTDEKLVAKKTTSNKMSWSGIDAAVSMSKVRKLFQFTPCRDNLANNNSLE